MFLNKKKKIFITLFTFIILISVFFLKKNNNKVLNEIKILRLDKELFFCKDKKDLENFVDKNLDIVNKIYRKKDESKGHFIERFFKFIKNEEIIDFLTQVNNYFYDISKIEKELNLAFFEFKKIEKNCKVPEIIFVFTGLDEPYCMYEDKIIVSIDFFLDQNSKYRPTNYPLYMQRIYNKDLIVHQIMTLYITKYVGNSKDETLLSDIIFYGKVIAILKKILPNSKDWQLTLFSKNQIYEFENSEGFIWSYVKENNLLYEKDENKKLVYLDFTEFCNNIYEECPGAPLLYIGYKIVDSYLKNNSVDFSFFLKDTNFEKIFLKSKYNPL